VGCGYAVEFENLPPANSLAAQLTEAGQRGRLHCGNRLHTFTSIAITGILASPSSFDVVLSMGERDPLNVVVI
jgi:hypothetical protein